MTDDNFREFGNFISEEYDHCKAEYIKLNCHESYWNIISINHDNNTVIARLCKNENGLYLEMKNQQN